MKVHLEKSFSNVVHSFVRLTLGISRSGALIIHTRRCRLHAVLDRPSVPGWPPARHRPPPLPPPCSHADGARWTPLETLGARHADRWRSLDAQRARRPPLL